jgi:hypothetical protein
MKQIQILIALLLIACGLMAETSGEKGFQMLKIVSSASSAAQGATGAFSAQDAFGFLENPAASLFRSGKTISVTQIDWIFDTAMNNGSYISNTGKSAVGITYRFLDYGKIERRDEIGDPIGEFHPMDFNVALNYARRLHPNHYAGININALYEKIDAASSFGFAFDLGYTWLTPVQDLKLAAAVKHLSGDFLFTEMDNEYVELPITMELGLIKDFTLGPIWASTEIKAIKHDDDDEPKANIGLNTRILEGFFLRGGYKLGYDAEDVSIGFGVNFSKFALDYAFIPFKEHIDDVHMFELSYQF